MTASQPSRDSGSEPGTEAEWRAWRDASPDAGRGEAFRGGWEAARVSDDRLREALRKVLDLWDENAPDPADVDRDVLEPARALLALPADRAEPVLDVERLRKAIRLATSANRNPGRRWAFGNSQQAIDYATNDIAAAYQRLLSEAQTDGR